MNTVELESDPAICEWIAGIVNHRYFLTVKDAFIAHTPAGEKEAERMQKEDPLVLAHGKLLGTRFVFNQLEACEKASQRHKVQKQQKSTKKPVGPDPDLEEA